nr:MAG TPA: hypothetical protein [Bacteriophage sp.]
MNLLKLCFNTSSKYVRLIKALTALYRSLF